MDLQGLYAVALVRDFDAAVEWYGKLFGRAPDDRPMKGFVQWRWDFAGVQLFEDAERAGKSRMTLVTPVMADARRRLADAGLDLGPETRGDFGVIAHISDPEGNLITLAEPPKG